MNYQGKCRLCKTPMHVVARSAELMVCSTCRRIVLCAYCLQPHERRSLWCSDVCRRAYQKTVTVETRKKS